jgi:hypothetical protein
VLKINIYCHHIDWLALLNFIGLMHWLIAFKVGRLIHIKPNSREFNFLIKSSELILPKFRGIRMQIINEINLSGPDLTNIISRRMIVSYKNIHLSSLNYTGLIMYWYPYVYQRDVMKRFLLKKIIEFCRWIRTLTDCKYLFFIHVIQVSPHRIYWQIILFIFFYNILENW